MDDRLLTINEVKDYLRCSVDTIYRYIKAGTLKAIRVGGLWRIPESSLNEFLGKDRDR